MTSDIDTSSRPRGGQVLVGLAIILVGLGFLAHRLDVWHVHLSLRMWPLVLLIMGGAKVIDRNARSGLFLIYIGLWGLVSEFRLFGLGYESSWPLLIIGVGLNTVWRAVEDGRTRRVKE